MALTPQEEAELQALESKGGQVSNLSPAEEAELQALEDRTAAQFDESTINRQAPQNVAAEVFGAQIPTLDAFMSRFMSKNLGTKTPETLSYVQGKTPEGLTAVRHPKTGEIFYQTKEGKNYPMDPSYPELQDITDILYDVPAGIAQGAATGAAGLGAAALATPTGPIGMSAAGLAGGSAMSGTMGGALEGARQSLGTMFGLNPGINKEDVTDAAKFGAIAPLIFGNSVTKQTAINEAKTLLSGAKGVTAEEVEKKAKEIMQSQKGLVGKAWDKGAGVVGSKLASHLGGWPEEVLAKARQMIPEFAAAKKDPAVYKGVVEDARQSFNNALQGQRKLVGEEYGNALKQLDPLGVTVNTEEIISPLVRLQQEIKGAEFQPEYKKQLLAEIEDIKKKYLYEKVFVPPKLTPQEMSLLNSGADVSKMGIPKGTEKFVLRTNLKASDAKNLADNLSDLGEKYGMTFGNIDTSKGIAQGTTAGAKDIARALTTAAKSARDQIDDQLVNVDPQLRNNIQNLKGQYSTIKDMEEEFFRATKSDEAFARFLKNKSNIAKEQKMRMSNMVGRDMNDLASEIMAYDLFIDPSKQIPSFGQSNTGRTWRAGALGAMISSMMADPSNSGIATTLAATVAAPYALSPSGIKQVMRADNLMRNIVPNIALPMGNRVMQDLPQYTPYMLMNMNKENNP